jgi:hypothetical protein
MTSVGMGSMSPNLKQLHTDPECPTWKLCAYVDSVSLKEIPQGVQTRTKYLILNGLARALTCAHLPWSETAAGVIFEMEPTGDSSVFGRKRECPMPSSLSYRCPFVTLQLFLTNIASQKVSRLSAALLNSTFIQ